MNKKFFVIIISLFIAGCGDLKTSSHFDPPKEKFNKYAALEVSDFETELPEIPEELLTKLPDEVAKLLDSEENGFKNVERGEVEGVPAENTLVLLGEITEYESGKDVKFEGGAVKFGEASITVELALVEKGSGSEITTGQVNGFSSLGFFRKGFIAMDVYNSLAEEIAKFVSENY